MADKKERPLRSLERFDPHLGCWEAAGSIRTVPVAAFMHDLVVINDYSNDRTKQPLTAHLLCLVFQKSETNLKLRKLTCCDPGSKICIGLSLLTTVLGMSWCCSVWALLTHEPSYASLLVASNQDVSNCFAGMFFFFLIRNHCSRIFRGLETFTVLPFHALPASVPRLEMSTEETWILWGRLM